MKGSEWNKEEEMVEYRKSITDEWNERLISVEQGRMIVHDWSEWRAVMNAWIMKQPWQPVKEVMVHLVWPLDKVRCGEGEDMSSIWSDR